MIEGEETKLLEQIHSMSKDILNDLMDIDTKLNAIAEDIKISDEIDKKTVLADLAEIRKQIGLMEKEDIEEMQEEQIVENINSKLKDLIKMALG